MGFFSAAFFERLGKALSDQAEAVSCASVANHFLELARQESRALTAMQLNSLLYLAHGWHLAYFDKPLLKDSFLAWRHGIKPLAFYPALVKHGSQGISSPFRSGPGPLGYEFTPDLPAEGMAFLHRCWTSHARFSGLELVAITTGPGSLWAQRWQGKEVFLDDADIKDHFQAKYQHLKV